MPFRTFDGQRLSDLQYEKKFCNLLRSALGNGYAPCPRDMTDARYGFGDGTPPLVAAGRIVEVRNNQTPETVRVVIWRGDDGEIEIRGADAGIDAVVRPAFLRGEREGAFIRWVENPNVRTFGDVIPQRVTWRAL